MSKKIVITGATGNLGKYITQRLISRGDEITIFSRKPDSAKNLLPGAFDYISWDAYQKGDWSKFISGKDAVIHLAGKSIFGNLASEQYKQQMMESREVGTRLLAEAINAAEEPPEVFVSASAIGYYGPTMNSDFTEESPSGNGFLSEVCVKWENAARLVEKIGVRRVSVRVGIVLDRDEGALNYLLKTFDNYLGGTIGDGSQWVSWIHKADCADLFIAAMDDKNYSGALNAVAPNPVTMNVLADVLSVKLEKPALLKLPSVAVKSLIGDASVPVTDGIKVIPRKAVEKGFIFNFPDLESALADLL